MNSFVGATVTVLTAVIGVAIIAVLVKQGNQTASVLQAAGSSFGNILSVAENPGNQSSPFGGGNSIFSL
jgi:hypothetical protein